MPFVDSESVDINLIIVKRENRQRREIETKGGLEDSISRNGLIHPIVVDENLVLIAGERRLAACKNLKWTTIAVRFAKDLSDNERQIIELEENVKRSDLTWQEACLATSKIHLLHKEIDPRWTQLDTADVISNSQATIAKHLRVAEFLKREDPRILAASSYMEAFNIICRRDARAEGNALEELLKDFDLNDPVELPPPNTPASEILVGDPYAPKPEVRKGLAETILHKSFLEWAPSYNGPKFNFVHCDFPYGINPFAGPQGQAGVDSHYEDSPEIYFQLLNCLLDNHDRLFSISCHLMFWFSDRMKEETLRLFEKKAPSFRFATFPLIWHKSDNAGISFDPRRMPRHTYETCLFAARGDRQIVRVVGDSYSCPTNNKLHPTCKPEPMLHHFFSMIVDDFTAMLDPTCGSGTSILAAERLSCQTCLGLESDWETAEMARLQLKNSRILRDASR